MRKQIHIILVCLLALTVINANAQSTLIHYWNFNSLSVTSVYTPTVDVIAPDYTDLPTSAHAGIVYQPLPGTSAGYTTYIETFASSTTDYDSVNLRMGAVAGNYIRLHNPSDSMALLLYTPSTRFQNLVLTFGTSRPANGMKYQDYDYSTDSGATWITTGLSLLSDSVWSTFQRITLTTTNPAVNNNPKLVFRIRFTGSITGTSGNNRFDNVTLDGDTTLAPAGITGNIAATESYTLFPNPVTNELIIAANHQGTKNITITNLLGQAVYQGTDDRSNFSVDLASLKPGYYLVRIKDGTTGSIFTSRFTKQ